MGSSPALNIQKDIEFPSAGKNFFPDDLHWHPRIIAELNGQHVKVAKLKGPFIWHRHDSEDEMFLVIKGRLRIRLRDETLEIEEGEIVVIPSGVEHKPETDEETHILLIEPASTLNTGDKNNDFTRNHLDWI